MNILKRELKTGRKAFILWSVGLFCILFSGMTKYTGFDGDENALELLTSFPKIVMAVFGIVDVDLGTLGGFYAIIVYYSIICSSIYGVSLGSKAVNREVVDRTYEFIYTKPRSRRRIFSLKMLTAFIYITLYCLLNYMFSLAVVATVKSDETITLPIILFTLSMWLMGILFYTLSAFLAAITKNAQRGALLGNLAFVVIFLLGILYDMLENGDLLRVFAPLKYFLSRDILAGSLDGLFLTVSLALSAGFYFAAMEIFDKKDLTA